MGMARAEKDDGLSEKSQTLIAKTQMPCSVVALCIAREGEPCKPHLGELGRSASRDLCNAQLHKLHSLILLREKKDTDTQTHNNVTERNKSTSPYDTQQCQNHGSYAWTHTVAQGKYSATESSLAVKSPKSANSPSTNTRRCTKDGSTLYICKST
jgi:hypothetical protein